MFDNITRLQPSKQRCIQNTDAKWSHYFALLRIPKTSTRTVFLLDECCFNEQLMWRNISAANKIIRTHPRKINNRSFKYTGWQHFLYDRNLSIDKYTFENSHWENINESGVKTNTRRNVSRNYYCVLPQLFSSYLIIATKWEKIASSWNRQFDGSLHY